MNKTKIVEFYDIDWDCDFHNPTLPKKVTLVVNDRFDVYEDGATLLSNTYGFSVSCFKIKKEKINEKI